MITIAVCDDNEREVKEIAGYVREEFEKLNIVHKIIQCSNGEDLIYELDEVGQFDIVFLDIELGRDNGIDAAVTLRQKNPYCQIIFVSGYKRYYKDAFRVQPFQFIDKPIDEQEIVEVIQAVAQKVVVDDQVFSFEYKWQQYRILLKDILYFVSDYRVIRLQTKDGKEYVFYGKMDEVESAIGEHDAVFLRLHKSYMVNMAHIKVFNGEDVVMQDEKRFKISARKKKGVLEKYLKYAS
jgi:DNA-binding LytR/AlgR family response regulator